MPQAAGLMPQARAAPRAAPRPARANVAVSAALLQHVSRTAPPPSPRPTAIGNEHAAPKADRDPGFDRGGEPCRPALGRDLERLVYRAAADLGPGLLVFGDRAGDRVCRGGGARLPGGCRGRSRLLPGLCDCRAEVRLDL